jgi:serine protease AprX
VNASHGTRRLVAFAGVLAFAAAIAVTPVVSAAVRDTAPLGAMPSGLSALVGTAASGSAVRGIAEFSGIPGAAQVAALKGLGLAVQPMKHLPLALVVGTVAQFQAAVSGGIAEDVYPDESIQLLDTASSDAMGAASLRAAGLDGRGVTVAVVDSGCDASHADLKNRVVHNVKLVSGEYANIQPDGSNTIVVPIELLPYKNSDLGSGHGTHVSGIIAADSSSVTDGSRYGVAPGASLVCLSIGEVLFTTAVVTAYDFLLDQPNMWNVRVVNNSWGNSYREFDPRDPVAVATKAVYDNGMTVVFAAGNSGAENAEMSLNPFSEAPWVISVAAGTLDHKRADSFSSNGLVFDNSQAVTIGAGGHNTFKGDRIGLYHPDVTAPGDSISSTCDTIGTLVGPCPPDSNATASGTSMASPHVAGAAAVLLQANPSLTPDQVRMALQATADPVVAGGGTAFWEVGYGYVNLQAAVDLVRSKGWATKLNSAEAKADSAVLAADGYKVQQADFWTYDAPRITVGTDKHTYSVAVPSTTQFIKVSLSHPSLAAVGINGTSYDVTVKDANGQVLGTTTESFTEGAGTATAFIDLRSFQSPKVAYGTFTFDVVGNYAVSDPDTLDSDSASGRMVSLQIAQVVAGH